MLSTPSRDPSTFVLERGVIESKDGPSLFVADFSVLKQVISTPFPGSRPTDFFKMRQQMLLKNRNILFKFSISMKRII